MVGRLIGISNRRTEAAGRIFNLTTFVGRRTSTFLLQHRQDVRLLIRNFLVRGQYIRDGVVIGRVADVSPDFPHPKKFDLKARKNVNNRHYSNQTLLLLLLLLAISLLQPAISLSLSFLQEVAGVARAVRIFPIIPLLSDITN